ncbi:uncharacterized protein CTHT_0068670 [Thermochaetoides thermophila DSM 1495]|uniref:Uncharacterized protein n=1 Tax=Chaetomium thermophilum (strain DSM 1495 / CBS 144.50 / IMI 039719) TaxID=759272 RepID=G0SH47_CHATD|nr:hypothetical protein CTHT_0068670 [Thermochaetoides thermophila DSM 1495]EGS17536.1 hypothetical protein CTHT_0068670 [Thermochaetoides thermophila DSM 1495]
MGQLTKHHGIIKADTCRGARPGLLPTSGPNKPISKKKLRKLERKMGYALKRKMEREGEVEMKDFELRGENAEKQRKEEEMEMDVE